VLRSLSILHPLFLHQHSALVDFVSTVGLWLVSNYVIIFEQIESRLCGPSVSECSMAIHYQNVNMMTVERCHYANAIWYQGIILISLYKFFSTWCRLQTFFQIISCHEGANITGKQATEQMTVMLPIHTWLLKTDIIF
jgi:hypothetical protein